MQEEYNAEQRKQARIAYCNRVNAQASERTLVELDEYAERLGAEMCIHAIEIALDAGKASWAYIRAILRNVCEAGYVSIWEWEEARKKR